MRPDMIDPRAIAWNGTDIGGWPATVELNGIDFETGRGVLPIYDRETADRRWPDAIPTGWKEPIQFTLHAIVRVNGQWIGGGYILFWRGRLDTGANWLEMAPDRTDGLDNWRANWADARFGAAHQYVPRVGDEVGFALSAGGNRMREVATVQERSPIVRLPLALKGAWRRPPEGPVVVEPPIVTEPPVVIPPDLPSLPALLGMMHGQLAALKDGQTELLTRLGELETLLQTPPVYDAPYLGALKPRRGPTGVIRG